MDWEHHLPTGTLLSTSHTLKEHGLGTSFADGDATLHLTYFERTWIGYIICRQGRYSPPYLLWKNMDWERHLPTGTLLSTSHTLKAHGLGTSFADRDATLHLTYFERTWIGNIICRRGRYSPPHILWKNMDWEHHLPTGTLLSTSHTLKEHGLGTSFADRDATLHLTYFERTWIRNVICRQRRYSPPHILWKNMDWERHLPTGTLLSTSHTLKEHGLGTSFADGDATLHLTYFESTWIGNIICRRGRYSPPHILWKHMDWERHLPTGTLLSTSHTLKEHGLGTSFADGDTTLQLTYFERTWIGNIICRRGRYSPPHILWKNMDWEHHLPTGTLLSTSHTLKALGLGTSFADGDATLHLTYFESTWVGNIICRRGRYSPPHILWKNMDWEHHLPTGTLLSTSLST